jgi:hypothetical protein
MDLEEQKENMYGRLTVRWRFDMAAKPRQPGKGKLARAGRDMHDRNPKVRKEAAEVLAVAPRRKPLQGK